MKYNPDCVVSVRVTLSTALRLDRVRLLPRTDSVIADNHSEDFSLLWKDLVKQGIF